MADDPADILTSQLANINLELYCWTDSMCAGVRSRSLTSESVCVTNFFLIKPTHALISQIYFCQETLHVSGSSSAHHQEFYTARSALVYVMHV